VVEGIDILSILQVENDCDRGGGLLGCKAGGHNSSLLCNS
jgi:hypothetical protein